MKNLHKILVPFALVLLCLPAQAEVEAVNIVLHDGGGTYTVPSKKVLIIEHFMWALEADSTSQRIAIQPTANPVGDFALEFTAEKPDMFTPPRPIRLIAGGRVSILKNGGVDWRNVMIVGLLVDNEDLYAAKIDSQINSCKVVGGRLMADASFDSPRPRITKVETTTALESFSFSNDTTSELAETSSPSRAVASAAASTQRKSLRVTARAREVE